MQIKVAKPVPSSSPDDNLVSRIIGNLDPETTAQSGNLFSDIVLERPVPAGTVLEEKVYRTPEGFDTEILP